MFLFMKRCNVSFEDIVSVENLCAAWEEFIIGKRNKKDVQDFQLRLVDEIVLLHEELVSGLYCHGGYHQFSINDPKPRVIHKAAVRDRLLHHAIHRQLYPYFARTFIADSFSCQVGKGVHRALRCFRDAIRQVSANNRRSCWVLKCDIRKFFASIDQALLIATLRNKVGDEKVRILLEQVIASFSTCSGKGVPLGNLISQLFANIVLDELDQFVKHILRWKKYLRYADDFVFLTEDRIALEKILPQVKLFLSERLELTLHPQKVILKTVASGVDFLGWVFFEHHAVLRTKTKRRMFARIRNAPEKAVLQSYLGVTLHGNAFDVLQQLKNEYWLWREGE